VSLLASIGIDKLLFGAAIALITMVGAGAILLLVGIVLAIAHAHWVRKHRRSASRKSRADDSEDNDERRRLISKICIIFGIILLAIAAVAIIWIVFAYNGS
jgi:ABC-type Fe3+ transport system permease subunit